ncbi:hypothetical protein MASR2M36_38910 [Providencia sp.]
MDEPGVGVDPIARRELWQMVHTLADDGMLILWSTSYLDEAQQCQNVLLLNKGKQLYSGKPELLTQKMAGRSYLLDVPTTQKRTVLQNALVLPETTDGVIQGRYIRLILKPNASHESLLNALNLSDKTLIAAQPRFEDASLIYSVVALLIVLS